MSSVIYFIEGVGTGMVKIGTTTNLSERVKSIQAMSPVEVRAIIVVPGTVFAEKQLHRYYERHRSHGEWFFNVGALTDLINKLKNGCELGSVFPNIHNERALKTDSNSAEKDLRALLMRAEFSRLRFYKTDSD